MAIEYCIVETSTPITAEELNEMCIDGWEFLQALNFCGPTTGYINYFKKEK